MLRRVQRNAKYRSWGERRDMPWDNASDALISDMTSASLRQQDTLHNAVPSVFLTTPYAPADLLSAVHDAMDST